MDRLGSDSILDNLGIFLLFTIVLILVVGIVILLGILFRRNKKVREIVKKI